MEIIDRAIKKAVFIRQDYANHVVYGEILGALGVILGLLFVHLVYSIYAIWWLPALISTILVSILAAFKEVYSLYTSKGEASWKDFLYTISGAIIINIIYLLGALPK